ncbi:hypothetical protein KUTeg_005619 [Tegillarca granosa]|uniref:Rab-GAP TBC domain-containing protein n=1 Tax=Tegillarca granosa TaxID=220873 RepID=A0ABQ9FPR8_TEGGR|nr:hypothetical protein KUTeg_005619 [Tegillarca granosa]
MNLLLKKTYLFEDTFSITMYGDDKLSLTFKHMKIYSKKICQCCSVISRNKKSTLSYISWIGKILSIFSKSLPLDIACRVWDVFCRDGDEFLFRTALGLLKLFEDVLLNLDFIHLCQFLTKLPDDLTGDLLFKSIECIHMNIDKKKFTQILAANKEMKDTSS